jgi:putative ABC transport system permease protein
MLTGGSVGLALFLFCTLQALLSSLDMMVAGSGGGRLISSSAISLFQSLPLSSLEKVRAARIPGVLELGHWTWFGGVYIDPKEFFARYAVDVSTFRRQYGDLCPHGEDYILTAAQWDRFEQEKASCIIGRGLADRYELSQGDSLVLEGDIYPGTYEFAISAIYTSSSPTYDEESMFFHWEYLNEAMGELDEVGTIMLSIDEDADSNSICMRVDDLFRNSSTRTLTQPESAFNAQFLSMWGNVGLLFNFIGMAVIFATFMISLNTMLLSVSERVREIGVLKSIGYRASALRNLYLAESMLICGGGALLGALLARLMWHGQPLRLATVVFPEIRVADETLLQAGGIGLGLALVAGIAPAFIASRTSIVGALR